MARTNQERALACLIRDPYHWQRVAQAAELRCERIERLVNTVLGLHDPLLSCGDVAELMSCCTKTIHRYERDGKIPKAQRTTGNMRRWRLSEIVALMLEREKEW